MIDENFSAYSHATGDNVNASGDNNGEFRITITDRNGDTTSIVLDENEAEELREVIERWITRMNKSRG